jgi:hypothetical protein
MRALLLAAIGALLWPASSAATMRHLAAVPGEIDAVAYAGPERLYASGHRLLRLGPEGRPLQVARLHGEAVQLVASPTAVALIEGRGRDRWLLAGPPAGPLRELASCHGARREIPLSLLALAGSTIAEALSCERAQGVYTGAASFRLHDGAAVRTVNAPAGMRAIALAGAPGLLAVAIQADSLRGPVRVDVVEAATGAPRYGVGGLREPPFVEPLALREDGLSAFCGPDGRLAWASPSEPTAHPIDVSECPTTVALAGDSLVFHLERDDALTVGDVLGRVRALVKPSGDLPFAWNGTHALVRGVGCGADFLGEIEPSPRPYRGPECPVRIARVARRGRAVDVTVGCQRGCRGDVQVLLGHGGDYDAAPLRVRRPGGRTVRVRLRDRARRLLARYRSVPVHVLVTYVNPADGASFQRSRDRTGTLPGDGRRPFPPPPPPCFRMSRTPSLN